MKQSIALGILVVLIVSSLVFFSSMAKAAEPSPLPILGFGDEFKLRVGQSASIENYSFELVIISGPICTSEPQICTTPPTTATLRVTKISGDTVTSTDAIFFQGQAIEVFDITIENTSIVHNPFRDVFAEESASFVVKKQTDTIVDIVLDEAFELNINQSGVLKLEDSKITVTLDSIIIESTCEPEAEACILGGPAVAILTVSQETTTSLGGTGVATQIELRQGEERRIFGIEIQNTVIGNNSASFIVRQPDLTVVYANLGEEFRLQEQQTGVVQDEGRTVIKVTLERIEILESYPEQVYAVITTSLPNMGGIQTFRVREGSSIKVADFKVYFNGRDIAAGGIGTAATIAGVFKVERAGSIPGTIIVNLGSEFELLLGQKAIVKETMLNVTLSDIYTEEIACITTPCEISREAELIVSMPITYSTEEPKAVTATISGDIGVTSTAIIEETEQEEPISGIVLRIKSGERKQVLGHVIEAMQVGSGSVLLKIEKATIPGIKTVYLNDAFKLENDERARVVERANNQTLLNIRMLEVLYPTCATPKVGTTEQSVSCLGKPIVRIAVSEPVSTCPIGGPCGAGAVLLNIVQGDYANFGVYKIFFHNAEGQTAVLEVSRAWKPEVKRVFLNEAFDLEIEQTALVVGERVFIKLEGIAEPDIACAAGMECISAPPIAIVTVSQGIPIGRSTFDIRLHDSIQVYGLNIRFDSVSGNTAWFVVTKTSLPEVINVHVGDPFSLEVGDAARVLEANLRIENLGINLAIPSCPPCIEGQACPVCPSTEKTVTFSVSRYLLDTDIGTIPVKSKILESVTVEASTSVESDSGTGGGAGVAIPREVPPAPFEVFTLGSGESVEVGNYKITINFVASDSAEFVVIEKTTGETFTYKIRSGWNLWSMPGELEIIYDDSRNTCNTEQWVFIEYNKKASNPTEIWKFVNRPLPGKAYWLYNFGQSCTATAKIRREVKIVELDELRVNAVTGSWNFVPIIPDMIGHTITELGCQVNEAYYYDNSASQWVKWNNKIISQSDLGKSIAVSVREDCSLGLSTDIIDLQVLQGQTFDIELESHATAGYEWKMIHMDRKLEFIKKSQDLSSCAAGIVGCSGKTVFTFRAIESGIAEIVFSEGRHWESNETRTIKKYVIEILPLTPPSVPGEG